MTNVCINGAGFAGLSTALLLAADGHDVTVIERDPPPPSRDPEQSWSAWQRRAVPQFRQTHAYLARCRLILRDELPHVWTRLVEANVSEHNLALQPPATIGDRSPRPGDDDLAYVGARRSTVEHVLHHAAADDPRVQLLGGVAAKGLLTTGDGGRLAAAGLATNAGPLEADLVVDCGGPRSQLPAWIEDAGGVRPVEDAAEYRIAYWTQWFQRQPGAAMPSLAGPPAVEIGPIELLRVPADNGWFSVTVVAAAEDVRFRVLSDQRRLLAFLAALPLTANWVDPTVARPKGGVQPMFPIVDQRRRFLTDGGSCAARLVAVGDSLAASNPTLAQGTSFALMQAVALRDLLRADDHIDTVHDRYHHWTETTFEPWWQSTIAADQAHLARLRAAARGDRLPADPAWMFQHAAMHDPDLWRVALRVRMVLDHPQDLLAAPEVHERVAATLARIGPPNFTEMDFDGLLAA
jgi:2-polyprenyl-6-methoxyphenol hydroxylase-like FAD-dependent oxidoreductase